MAHPNWGKGKRGPKKYSYTYEDIANFTGFKCNYLRLKNHKGVFKIGSLESVLEFIIRCNLEYIKRFISDIESGLPTRLNLLSEQDRKRRLKQLIKQTKHVKF